MHLRRCLSLCTVLAAAAAAAPPAARGEVGMPPPGAPRHGWGPEQATGEPDTMRAGDIQTAWAALRPDDGTEWLKLGFQREVTVAEVRVRETFNPGAVSKVVAIPGGDEEEVLLWQGLDLTREAPASFVVKVPADKEVKAKVVKVYLETGRVQGWNEIDAVELVGRDGSRQWAATASASSSFAVQQPALRPGPFPPPQPPPPRQPPPDPYRELRDREVTVRLDGGKTLVAEFVRADADFVVLRQPADRKTLFVNKRKIVLLEVVVPADF